MKKVLFSILLGVAIAGLSLAPVYTEETTVPDAEPTLEDPAPVEESTPAEEPVEEPEVEVAAEETTDPETTEGETQTETEETTETTPEESPTGSETTEEPVTTAATNPDTTTEEETGINNRVIIKYIDETLLDTEVFTTSTYFLDATGEAYSNDTITALGVLMNAARQENITIEVLNYGYGYYVSTIDGIAPAGFDGWIYNINMEDPGYTGIGDYLITDADELDVFYSVWPSKITRDVTETTIDSPITFTSHSYTDATWSVASSTTISINTELFETDESGVYVYTPTATGTVEAFIYGTEAWPQNSPSVTVEVTEATEEENETPSTGGSSTPVANDTTDYLVSDEEIDTTIDALLDYFRSQQDEDGQIIDGPTTDWIVMSFGAAEIYGHDVDQAGTSLYDYMEDYDLSDPMMELNICASYPRHYLALRATGITDDTLIERIALECDNDGIYGQEGINDDVFALFALLSSGESTDTSLVQTILTTILEDQTEDGAFTWAGYASADITGAALNVLTYADEKGVQIEETVYDSAIDYLKVNQLTDGGWGFGTSDILTTSWAMMGLNARNQSQAEWMTDDNKSPWHVLTENLTDDGYYEASWAPGSVDWFGTKHAVPALAGSSWPVILETIGETVSPSAPGSSWSPAPTPEVEAEDDTATTTLDIDLDTTTSTLDMVTTTEDIVLEEETTTSTPEIYVDPLDLLILEQTESAPTEVLGAKIEYTVTTPLVTETKTAPVLTTVEESPVVTSEDADKEVEHENEDEKTEEMEEDENQEESMINMKDVRNIVITIIVFILGFAALKFFKILV